MAPEDTNDPKSRSRASASATNTVVGILMLLTATTGLMDAISYLGLGHVFVANMTGNVVFLGFALAGATGFAIAPSLVAAGAFLAGAVIAGRVSTALGARWKHWLPLATGTQTVLAAVAATANAVSRQGPIGNLRFGLIAVLALGTGIQNATVRKLAVPDVTTTVLTLTLTGIAADSSLAGGTNPRLLRRTCSVAAMLVGALVGAALMIHAGLTTTLWATTVLYAAITCAFLCGRRALISPP